jgi:DNA repair photolyase
MEPRTATAKNRLQTIRILADAGIPVGVMAAPLIPGLNHTEVPSILKEAAAHGAITAGYTVVRLNGALKEIFYDWLQKNFPDRATKVWNLISDMHGGQVNDSHFGRRMTGEGPIADMIKQLFTVARHKYMHNQQMPAYNYSLFRRGGTMSLFENSI